MSDANMATLIVLVFVGLLGMFIGYGSCLIRLGRENKGLRKQLIQRNQDNLTANSGVPNEA